MTDVVAEQVQKVFQSLLSPENLECFNKLSTETQQVLVSKWAAGEKQAGGGRANAVSGAPATLTGGDSNFLEDLGGAEHNQSSKAANDLVAQLR
ncbi:hypothetical protein [Streptomyces subrutilus]|uniref:hypothetical protein n=1 Tax=Streptomyces subrutilus TaxID=36818 RepID=UPI00340B2718